MGSRLYLIIKASHYWNKNRCPFYFRIFIKLRNTYNNRRIIILLAKLNRIKFYHQCLFILSYALQITMRVT